MFKQTGIIVCITFMALTVMAQSKAERQAIKDMCGCFEVDFRFKETFAHVPDYELTDEYSASALELVYLDKESKNKIVLQHILIVQDTVIIKHWRQDWEYETDHLFAFDGNNTWTTTSVSKDEVDGQWSQEVYGTDDTPRYSGSSTWFIADGRRVWENTANAPLPRREYTKRSDYQVMRRLNSHILTDDGWVHEQDNEKIVVDEDGEYVLVEEKGRNTYMQVDDLKCKLAKEWWENNRKFWHEVRVVWNEWLEENRTYTVHKKQGDDFLPKELKMLANEKYDSVEQTRTAIRKTLEKYVTDVSQLNASR